MRPWEYRGRWALVTGASAGLGELFAHRLAERGMSLVLTARREERLRTLAAALEARHGVQALPLAADLGRPGAAAEVWAEASRGRYVHLLVNNAGFGAQGRFDEVPRERLVEMVQVNCIAPLELAHLALPGMRERGDGGIVNVASLAAFQAIPRVATYAATKAFLLSLSRSLWAENRYAGVRVVALCPGRTPTEFQAVAGTGNAAGSFGARTPEEVVDAGLRALEHGSSEVVPGVENHLASWLLRILPAPLATLTLRRFVHRASRRR